MRTAFLVLAFGVFGCGRLAPDAGDAATDAGTGDATTDAALPLGGTVIVTEGENGVTSFGGATHYGVDVFAFFSGDAPLVTTDCNPKAFGAHCALGNCVAQLGTPVSLSAGSLTIAGGPFGQGVDVAQSDAGNEQYSYGMDEKQLMTSGDVLTASASGDQIPAFTAQLSVPSNIAILTPQAPYTFAVGQDATFTWSGGESGASVVIRMGPAFCTFDSAAGTGTFPQDMLTAMNGTVQVSITVIRDTKVAAGNYGVDFSVQRASESTVSFQ